MSAFRFRSSISSHPVGKSLEERRLPKALKPAVFSCSIVFVDTLNMKELEFVYSEPKETGRKAYNPASMLKLYIYGYIQKIRSSRRLEVETQRNIELMWLMEKLTPDFKTISDFRKDNTKSIKKVFREFTILCKRMNLFGKELTVID